MPVPEAAGGVRATTIKDVAAAAGVGVATVSRALSGSGAVRPQTRERVLEAVRRLDYRPSAVGRGLKLRRTGSIGLLVTDVTDPFSAALVDGVLECARTLGEHVVLGVSRDDAAREAEVVEGLIERRVDGIIAVPAQEDAATWRTARRLGLSVVFAGRRVEGLSEVPTVLADDRAGVRTLVDYLVGLGHRCVGYLGTPWSVTAGRVREEEFRAALAGLGVPLDGDLVVRARSARDSAYAAAASLFQRRPDVTAVLAANHLLGEAAVLAARELQLRVPADVSIAMVDDVPWAELCDPPLTVVTRPARDMGYRACEVLLRDRTADPGRRRAGARARPLMLATELVVRSSCGPPRGRVSRGRMTR